MEKLGLYSFVLDENGNNKLIKAICFPFEEGVERIVHCKALNPNEERFIIKEVYYQNFNNDIIFNDDFHVAVAPIKWDVTRCLAMCPANSMTLVYNKTAVYVGVIINEEEISKSDNSSCSVKLESCLLRSAMKWPAFNQDQHTVGSTVN